LLEQNNAGKIGGGIVGGAAFHAITGGAAAVPHAVATLLGVAGGVVVGDNLDKK